MFPSHDHRRKKMEKRIANMASGVAVIKVGATSNAETRYLKLKIEDGVYAAKSALEEGVVPGGGMALKKIAGDMPESILVPMLEEPHRVLLENAGGELEITDDIVDPVKVTKAAVTNATSVASMPLTSHAIIAQRRKKTYWESNKLIADAHERANDLYDGHHKVTELHNLPIVTGKHRSY